MFSENCLLTPGTLMDSIRQMLTIYSAISNEITFMWKGTRRINWPGSNDLRDILRWSVVNSSVRTETTTYISAIIVSQIERLNSRRGSKVFPLHWHSGDTRDL